MPEVPPRRDHALDTWSENFGQRIVADPEAYGVGAGDALAFRAAAAEYAASLTAATDPGTRTRSAVAGKNAAKRALLRHARQLVRIISAQASVTDSQRADLGLALRDGIPSPIPAPATRPVVLVDPFGRLRLMDETTPTRRGKPAHVLGALLYTKIAPAAEPPPATLADATFACVITRPIHRLPLPPGAKGQTLHVLAQWINPRGHHGPVSAVVSTPIAA